VRVGESELHGRGLFARRRIRKGARIGAFEGRPTSRDGPHVLWLRDDDGSEEGIVVENELRFLNHSRRPNAEIDGLDLYALRNIQPGAEILIHYGDDWDDVE
jgi:SET domain-containing protein